MSRYAPTVAEVAAAKLKIAVAAKRGRTVEPWVREIAAGRLPRESLMRRVLLKEPLWRRVWYQVVWRGPLWWRRFVCRVTKHQYKFGPRACIRCERPLPPPARFTSP